MRVVSESYVGEFPTGLYWSVGEVRDIAVVPVSTLPVGLVLAPRPAEPPQPAGERGPEGTTP